MTVCLAALCTDGEEQVAVVAADRMVTIAGFIEFEHGVPKMAHPSEHAVVMIAGDTLVGTRLAREVAGSLDGAEPRTIEIAQQLAMKYRQVRDEALEQQVLVPRALTLQAFYGAHQSFNPQLAMLVDQAMTQTSLNVELLLAGVDQGGAHIFSVHNPGTELQHDVISYAAIGSGAIHALQSMIGFGHTSAAGFPETIFRVYASKRRSEVAPGVGQETDIAIVRTSGVTWLDQASQTQLASVYSTYQETAASNLRTSLSDLSLDGDRSEDL